MAGHAKVSADTLITVILCGHFVGASLAEMDVFAWLSFGKQKEIGEQREEAEVLHLCLSAIFPHARTHKQTDRQTNGQLGKRASKQASKQALNRQISFTC